MKKMLLTLSLVATATLNCQAGPSWGVSLSNGSGFYWNSINRCSRPIVMPYRERCYVQSDIVFQGPQYYRVHGVPHGTRIRNYTDAPLVITRPGGSRQIIPKSWD
jgi:hypothetical protein